MVPYWRASLRVDVSIWLQVRRFDGLFCGNDFGDAEAFGLRCLIGEVTARGKVASIISRSCEVPQLGTVASGQTVFFVEITVARQCACRISRIASQALCRPQCRAGLRRVEDRIGAVAQQLGVTDGPADGRLARLQDVCALRGVCRGPSGPTLYGSGSTIAMPILPLPVGNGLPGTGVSAPVVELIANP